MDRALLKSHVKWAEAAQGPELFPYRDTVGKLTIAFGRNLDDKGITVDEAELMLDNDLDSVELEAESLPYWGSLNPTRQLVIADMIYNLGFTKFKYFVNLNAALAIGDYQLAAHEMRDSRWYNQTLRRASVLVDAMASGYWNY